MKNTILGSLYLTIASSIWGSMFVVVKILVDVIPPFELVWFRYLVALITLLIIGIVTKQNWRIDKRHLPLFAVMGVLGYAVSAITQESGTMLSSAQMGAIITSSTPAFMIVFACIILKERLTLRKGISISLATVGVIIIVGVHNLNLSNMTGGILLVISALTWALVSVLISRLPAEYSQVAVVTYSMVMAFAALTPFVIPKLHAIDLSQLMAPKIAGGLLYLGVISTATGFLLWNRGLRLLNASSGGVFFFFQPIVGALLGWVVLKEIIGISFWIGSALILTGVLFVIREKPIKVNISAEIPLVQDLEAQVLPIAHEAAQ